MRGIMILQNNREELNMNNTTKSKSYTNYFEKDGKYYRQNMTWWEKGGYCIPQTPCRISKEEYEKMTNIKRQESR